MVILAIAYLAAMVGLGDAVARRFLPMATLVQRLSAAFVVGLLLATWLTYLTASVFGGLDQPMIVANVVVFGVAALALQGAGRRLLGGDWRPAGAQLRRMLRREWRDLLVLAGLGAVATWLAVSTYRADGGDLGMSFIVYSDFGSTTAIAQSFAVGNNFPTVLPHFPLEPIRYHFLFFFGVGNLTFLGMDPSLAMNVLSVLSMTAMLGLLVTLGRVLFKSAAVGWLGAALFFVHGSLSWIVYFTSQPSFDHALAQIAGRREFLPSGFDYRGEDWGVWSMAIYANQRHFASGIAVLLLVLIFLIGRWQARERGRPGLRERLAAWRTELRGLGARARRRSFEFRGRDAAAFGFAGLLLGLLPMWNGAVFVSAFVLLAVLFVLMPERRYMFVLAAGAAIAALPQFEFVRPTGVNAAYPALELGYTIDDPTPLAVGFYMAMIFGPKLLLGTVALALLRWLHLRLFLAGLALVVLTFTVQFSAEMLVNHKFLNIWLILLNMFVAFTLLMLWRAPPVANLMFGRLAAGILIVVIAAGGIIDLMPFRNAFTFTVAYRDDPLVEWVLENSDERDVFLTDVVVTHPILLAGRSIYLGWPYNALSAGYEVRQREATYRELYSERDPQRLLQLLRDNQIAWVAWDEGIWTSGRVPEPYEDVYRENFRLVFESPNYRNIRIYEVP